MAMLGLIVDDVPGTGGETSILNFVCSLSLEGLIGQFIQKAAEGIGCSFSARILISLSFQNPLFLKK